MKVRFTESAYKDFLYWKKKDLKKYERIKKLCRAIIKNPFRGIGKPEPLKFHLHGHWSRRIDKTHRLVYTMQKNGEILVVACRYHY